MKRIRVLNVIHGLNRGGAESFVYNVLDLLDENSFEIDFLIQNPHIGHNRLKQLIESKGGKIYLITDFRKNIFRHIAELNSVIGSGYDYVHIHMNAFVNPFPAIVASRYNNKVIIHSHNTRNGSGGEIGKLCHKVNTKLFLRRKFINLACGKDAGRWMFGAKKFSVVNNAINLDRFTFNIQMRRSLRSQYGLTDEFIIGQVGRLTEVKNHEFSLMLLKGYLQKYSDTNVRLMFVGEGDLRDSLEAKARALGLEQNVIFVGGVDNPYDYYSAFDCLILPSFFEGFAFVAVEAQGAGLKIIASNCNTSDINISGQVTLLPLNNLGNWIEALHNCKSKYDRNSISMTLKGSTFDDGALKRTMENIYRPYSK